MKIIVLDGHGLNPGDLSWAGFEKLGEVTIYDRTPQNEQTILERIGDAEIVLVNKVILSAEVIEKASHLKYIGVNATGFNVVDIEAARKRNIPVTNIPTYGTDAVAQFTFALLLEIASRIGLHDHSVHQGDWQKSLDFTYFLAPTLELSGKTIGIIGYGAIGQAVAKIAHGFSMEVIYYNHREKTPQNIGDRQVSLAELYSKADIVSLHVPQTPETTQMINAAAIDQMKNDVIVINTARGGLLDEQAVTEALNTGKISALGVDVVSSEPIQADNPLLKAKNAVITPHIAWSPTEARKRLMDIAVDNLDNFLKDTPKNVVN